MEVEGQSRLLLLCRLKNLVDKGHAVAADNRVFLLGCETFARGGKNVVAPGHFEEVARDAGSLSPPIDLAGHASAILEILHERSKSTLPLGHGQDTGQRRVKRDEHEQRQGEYLGLLFHALPLRIGSI